jgi:hypothetical protein
LNILEATADPKLFAPWFKDRASWANWLAWLAALMALPMTPDQLATYRECTGRNDPPKARVIESWLCCGRRSGKSFILALTAVYLACFFNWKPYLTPGEAGYVLIVAADRRQAKTIFRYIRALITEVPMLARLVKQENAESVELTNGIIVDIATVSHKTIRGRTVVACLADEISFWQGEDSSSSDREVLDAIRPSMATIPGAMLLCASSPYARRGAMWDAYEQWYGKPDSPVMFWKAATRVMNPSVPQEFIDAAYARDPSNAAAEYGADFRTDIEALVSLESVMACVKEGVTERKPERRHRYTLGVDISGGVSDSSTMAIAHREGSTVIIDKIVERKAPHSPEVVIEEFAAIAKTFRCTKAIGDRYSGNFASDAFRIYGLNYEPSDRSRSELYGDFLPLLNSGGIDLLDNDRLINQLVGLERRTSRSGKDQIDHGPGGHDDVANCTAMAACNVRKTDHSDRPPITHENAGGYDVFKQTYSPRTNQ